jgi:hypothetical protein
MAAKEVGIDFSQLVCRILDTSLEVAAAGGREADCA